MMAWLHQPLGAQYTNAIAAPILRVRSIPQHDRWVKGTAQHPHR